MTIEDYHAFCRSLPDTIEDFPFGPSTMVMKVGTAEVNKLFALTNVEEFEFINLKVDPEESLELQVEYPAITPGWHMNKKHWISVAMDESLPDEFIEELIENSYAIVRQSLPKKIQDEIAGK